MSDLSWLKQHHSRFSLISELLRVRELLLVVVSPSPKMTIIINSKSVSVPRSNLGDRSTQQHLLWSSISHRDERRDERSIVLSLSALTEGIIAHCPDLSILIKSNKMIRTRSDLLNVLKLIDLHTLGLHFTRWFELRSSFKRRHGDFLRSDLLDHPDINISFFSQPKQSVFSEMNVHELLSLDLQHDGEVSVIVIVALQWLRGHLVFVTNKDSSLLVNVSFMIPAESQLSNLIISCELLDFLRVEVMIFIRRVDWVAITPDVNISVLLHQVLLLLLSETVTELRD